LFLAGTYDKGVRSPVQERYKNRLCFPFRNSAAVSGLFSFTVPTGVIFSVRRKSASSQVVKKLSAVV
jgi:hypothetical protein